MKRMARSYPDKGQNGAALHWRTHFHSAHVPEAGVAVLVPRSRWAVWGSRAHPMGHHEAGDGLAAAPRSPSRWPGPEERRFSLRRQVHSTVNTPDTTELHTDQWLRWRTPRSVYFTTIKEDECHLSPQAAFDVSTTLKHPGLSLSSKA